MSHLKRFLPSSMTGQMISVLVMSLLLLLAVLTFIEIVERDSALAWADRDVTLNRLKRMKYLMENMEPDHYQAFLDIASLCHEGYTVSSEPFPLERTSLQTDRLGLRLARELTLDPERVVVGHAFLDRDHFSYAKCNQTEIALPKDAIVISLKLPSGDWLNAEVHPHEWHAENLIAWMIRSTVIFLLIGGTAMFFMRRLSLPLKNLTDAANLFASGLEVSEVPAQGTPDLIRAIQSFNAMQRQVANEINNRTNTLAAISHDVRTPLTALRLKAELIEDPEIRDDLIVSIQRMEHITASALEFLKGESRTEPMRLVDLSTLLEDECLEFSEWGKGVTFMGSRRVRATCRPEALTRAVRNLIENAVKYGDGVEVTLRTGSQHLDIVVSDNGPGIPPERIQRALEPFVRLSRARESDQGGFGLGLAVAKAIAEGHEGTLLLLPNQPTGLVAMIRIPVG